ncbi:MAG: signal peptidase I [Oscillospiraceae bacterium]|nr:signal peptidase I [Oscillospiraceae bacterium]
MAKEKKTQETDLASPQDARAGAIRSDVRIASFDWVESLIIAIIVVGVVFTFVFRIVTVSGTSMVPNLQNNDRIIVSSWFYQPKQGDVVVLKKTVGLNEPIVKRVIATEGQTVYLDYDHGEVYVDGKKLDETEYLGEMKTYRPQTSEILIAMPEGGVTVPEGHIFVLGDNREVSLDSRYEKVGMVDTRYILGKAQLKLFPFNRFGVIQSYDLEAAA